MGEMIIKKPLIDLLNRLKKSPHMLPLLEDELTSVAFSLPNQPTITLFMNRKDIWIEEECQQQPSLIITGDLSPLLELIGGKTRLQVLEKRGEILVYGKYKYILKVESLLYCCSYQEI